MPWFEYEGLTPGGTAIAGRIEAAELERARENLAQMQIEVRTFREAAAPPTRAASLSADDLVFFNEQLASLADAGIALDEGLAQLARDIESPRLRRWIDEVVEDLRRGVPLDQAIASREANLPILYSQVVRAGIETGELPATLLSLNQHLRLAGRTRRIVWEVASYPLVVAAFALIVVSGFFTQVVPHFKAILEDFGAALPHSTVLLLAVSDHYPMIMLVVALIVAVVVSLWHVLRFSSAGRAWRESILFAFPVIGGIHHASLVSRFLRAVSTTVGSGVPLPRAIRLGAQATGSIQLGRDAEQLAVEVEQGRSIFTANQSTRVIPPLFGFCVQVAVGRDVLPAAIAGLAQSYENRAIHAQSMLRVVLFPVLVIVVGGFLAFAVMALFLPLVNLINAVSGGA